MIVFSIFAHKKIVDTQSMFWSINRKICIPLHTPVLLYKSEVQMGVPYTDMFS